MPMLRPGGHDRWREREAGRTADYGVMPAAMAAFGDKLPPEIPLQAGPDD